MGEKLKGVLSAEWPPLHRADSLWGNAWTQKKSGHYGHEMTTENWDLDKGIL
ncbi:hypothetical protein QG37_02361 [Candidozyma auris]|uniref:Uncharacterized protein n=1 Tax=Candidozyma auris TaxID=498019 RepID=A0A0L0P1T9_CANAR|nr:hypothetical protein QG37_02361 [[Candida] auris]